MGTQQKIKTMLFIGLIFVTLPSVAYSVELTGVWRCDDGGIYYMRQVGYQLWWFGERTSTNPAWSNVAHGEIVGNQVHLDWVDVPKGKVAGGGKLILEIQQGETQLRALKKSGGFGGNIWKRQRYGFK